MNSPTDSKRNILQAWFDFCNRNTTEDVTVTFAEELTGKDATRPQGNYLSLKLITGPQASGIDEYRRKPGKSNFSLAGMRQYSISIQAFRADADLILADLQTLLDSSLEILKMKESADIAIVDRGVITDVSSLLDAGWERRYAMDVVFNVATNLETKLGPIEKVEFSGKASGGRTGEITVDPVTVSKP